MATRDGCAPRRALPRAARPRRRARAKGRGFPSRQDPALHALDGAHRLHARRLDPGRLEVLPQGPMVAPARVAHEDVAESQVVHGGDPAGKRILGRAQHQQTRLREGHARPRLLPGLGFEHEPEVALTRGHALADFAAMAGEHLHPHRRPARTKRRQS